MPVILATWEAEIRRIAVRGQIVCETLSSKYSTQNRLGKEAQVVERLPKQVRGPEFKSPVLQKQRSTKHGKCQSASQGQQDKCLVQNTSVRLRERKNMEDAGIFRESR
jgi:hypothetical protein